MINVFKIYLNNNKIIKKKFTNYDFKTAAGYQAATKQTFHGDFFLTLLFLTDNVIIVNCYISLFLSVYRVFHKFCMTFATHSSPINKVWNKYNKLLLLELFHKLKFFAHSNRLIGGQTQSEKTLGDIISWAETIWTVLWIIEYFTWTCTLAIYWVYDLVTPHESL